MGRVIVAVAVVAMGTRAHAQRVEVCESDWLDATRLEAILLVEIGETDARFRIDECDAEGARLVLVREGVEVTRRVSVQDTSPSSRVRLIALMLAELLRLPVEHPEPTPPEVAPEPVAPEPAPPAPPTLAEPPAVSVAAEAEAPAAQTEGAQTLSPPGTPAVTLAALATQTEATAREARPLALGGGFSLVHFVMEQTSALRAELGLTRRWGTYRMRLTGSELMAMRGYARVFGVEALGGIRAVQVGRAWRFRVDMLAGFGVVTARGVETQTDAVVVGLDGTPTVVPTSLAGGNRASRPSVSASASIALVRQFGDLAISLVLEAGWMRGLVATEHGVRLGGFDGPFAGATLAIEKIVRRERS